MEAGPWPEANRGRGASAASILEAKDILGPRGGKVLNYTGYAAMALSMALFAFAGLRGVPT